MNIDEFTDLVRKGTAAAEKGFIPSAQAYFDQAAAIKRSPEVMSYQAYCLARGDGRVQEAAELCREAITKEPNSSLHYLIMGRILLLSGNRQRAISAFRKGLRAGPNPRIISELKKLGLRKPTVFKNLQRNHPLNRIVGKLLSRLGAR